MVSSLVTFFGRHFTGIPAFCFAAGVITGAAGWAFLFLGQVETMIGWEMKKERVSKVRNENGVAGRKEMLMGLVDVVDGDGRNNGERAALYRLGGPRWKSTGQVSFTWP